jgi:hypothetical protein
MHSLAGFLQFLAGSRPWLRHLDLVSGQLKTLEERMKNIGKSLRTDILKKKMYYVEHVHAYPRLRCLFTSTYSVCVT